MIHRVLKTDRRLSLCWRIVGFRERRTTVIARDRTLPSVVCSQYEIEIAGELLYEEAEMLDPALDVFCGFEAVLDTEPGSSIGVKLHETGAAFG